MNAPVLVIGESGQLAQELRRAQTGDMSLAFAGRRSFDLGVDDPGPLLDAHRPAAVINAAAYTDLDRAEREPEPCFAVNRDGPGRLAAACAARGVPLLHVSTDCVFDGAKPDAYVETDQVSPLSAYGRSKAEGETAVQATGGRHAIVRVAWVFGAQGSNFVTTMLRVARDREEVTVVSDQVGFPTWGRDLAGLSLTLARRLADGDPAVEGLWHAAGDEAIDRASMAEAIFAESRRHGGPSARVRPITTAEYAAPAKRPLNARLASERAREQLGWRPTPWREALAQVVPVLLAASSSA